MIDYTVIPLNEILKIGINEDNINNELEKFSCSLEKDLEDFLVRRAVTNEHGSFGRTFLFLDNASLEHGDIHILAFFSIAQTSVDLSDLPYNKKRKMLGGFPGRDNLKSCAAFLIGQIGRGDCCAKDMLPGKVILNECYSVIREANLLLGGYLTVLECREHMFGKFYEKEGFFKVSESLNEHGLLTLFKKVNFDEIEEKQ